MRSWFASMVKHSLIANSCLIYGVPFGFAQGMLRLRAERRGAPLRACPATTGRVEGMRGVNEIGNRSKTSEVWFHGMHSVVPTKIRLTL